MSGGISLTIMFSEVNSNGVSGLLSGVSLCWNKEDKSTNQHKYQRASSWFYTDCFIAAL